MQKSSWNRSLIGNSISILIYLKATKSRNMIFRSAPTAGSRSSSRVIRTKNNGIKNASELNGKSLNKYTSIHFSIRIHIEEDAGKSLYTNEGDAGRLSGSEGSLIDFNRAGQHPILHSSVFIFVSFFAFVFIVRLCMFI